MSNSGVMSGTQSKFPRKHGSNEFASIMRATLRPLLTLVTKFATTSCRPCLSLSDALQPCLEQRLCLSRCSCFFPTPLGRRLLGVLRQLQCPSNPTRLTGIRPLADASLLIQSLVVSFPFLLLSTSHSLAIPYVLQSSLHTDGSLILAT